MIFDYINQYYMKKIEPTDGRSKTFVVGKELTQIWLPVDDIAIMKSGSLQYTVSCEPDLIPI